MHLLLLLLQLYRKRSKALALCGCCRCHINALPSTTKCQEEKLQRHETRRCGPEKRLINVLLIINVTAEKRCKILYKIIYINDRKSLGKKWICQGGRGRGGARLTARWVAAISEKGFNSQFATCQSQYNCNNCSRQPKSNTLRWRRGKGSPHCRWTWHTCCLVSTRHAVVRPNEPKTAGPEYMSPVTSFQLPSRSFSVALSPFLFLVIVVSILGWTFVYVKF